MKQIVAGRLSMDIARQAATCEHNPGLWEPRFRELTASGLLRAFAAPGSELSLQFAPCAEGSEVQENVRYQLSAVLRALQNDCHVSIDLSSIQPYELSAWAREFSSALSEALPAGVPRRLHFSLQQNHAGLREYLKLRGCRELGFPQLTVRFNNEQKRPHDGLWMSLLELSHQDKRVMLVPSGSLRPLSGLHAIERGQSVLPVSLFEVRAGTAWITLEIDATRLTDPVKLRTHLGWCLRLADNLIDLQQWSDPRLRLDALLNRRVAIHITRIGELAATVGLRPEKISSFRLVQRWLLCVRKCFIRESNKLAKSRGPFPAFGAQELVANLTPHYGVADASRLVRNRSLRHRHLLALSPLSVFPDSCRAEFDGRWLNLIPAIGCADMLSMYGKDLRKNMGLRSWSRLLQMTAALAASSTYY